MQKNEKDAYKPRLGVINVYQTACCIASGAELICNSFAIDA